MSYRKVVGINKETMVIAVGVRMIAVGVIMIDVCVMVIKGLW